MEKTTYKFTAYVENFHLGINRSVRLYAGVNSATEALIWIKDMATPNLVSFGFYETKNDK